jgi:hypothetical protein
VLRLSLRFRRSITRYPRRCGSISALVLVAMVLMPVDARAGSLALVTCGGSTASEGWSAFTENAPAGSVAVPTCSESWTVGVHEPSGYPPGLEAHLPSGTISDARVGLQFTAPAGESIAGGDITVAPQASTDPGFNETGTYGVAQLATGSLENVFWQDVNYGIPTVAIPAGASKLLASALCGGSPGQSCIYEYLYVLGAHILLSPSATPAMSPISGSLTAGGLQHGTQDVSFTASDPGGPGIYQVTVAIDGKMIYQATPNLNGGACVPVGTDGASLEFYTANPCLQSAPVSLPIRTGTLPDGIHALTVTATDAASNVSAASQVIFRSGNLISTAGAGRVARTSGAGAEPAYLVRFDGRTSALLRGVHRSYADSSLTLSGTLTTPQGAVAPDVPVHLLAREGNYPGGTETVSASTATDAAGHWSLTAAKGPSRVLRVISSQASSASTQAATAVKESVSATISLRVHDQNGGRLSFTGRVSVSPLGRPRPIVVIEASSDGHRWQIVGHDVRTNSQGIYHLSYSSPFSVGGRFAFRASTPETSLWLQGYTGPRSIQIH